MANVMAGNSARNRRRISALERLEKHLLDHKNNHVEDAIVGEEWFKSHDKSQKIERDNLKKSLQ